MTQRPQPCGVQAPAPMQRTARRWPVSLALNPWWDDPQQAAAFLAVAGCRRSTGRNFPLPVHQRRDLTFTFGESK